MEMVRFYQEKHFHNWYRYGLSPVGFRKWHTVLDQARLSLWMGDWWYSIPPPTALDSTVIVITIMLQIIVITIKNHIYIVRKG